MAGFVSRPETTPDTSGSSGSPSVSPDTLKGEPAAVVSGQTNGCGDDKRCGHLNLMGQETFSDGWGRSGQLRGGAALTRRASEGTSLVAQGGIASSALGFASRYGRSGLMFWAEAARAA